MSDIPKSKRAYSNLEAHHKALEIRRKIAVELLASFAYSEKKLEEAVRKQTQHIQDPEHRAEYMDIVLDVEALFNMIKALRQSDNRFLKHLKD